MKRETFHAHPLIGYQIAPGGYLAVDLFFVLSGSIIAHAYEQRLREGVSVLDFFNLRLIRFLPFYLVGTCIGAALGVILIITGSTSAMSWSEFGLALGFAVFLLPTFAMGRVTDDMFPLNVPAWSLFYELIVNIAYAVLLRWLTTAVLIIGMMVSGAFLTNGVLSHAGVDFGPAFADATFALARTIYPFSAGLLIYRFRSSVPVNQFLLVLAATLIFFLPIDGRTRAVFDLLFVLFFAPMSVFVLLNAGRLNAPTRSSFSFLGRMSYGLYAVHYPLIWLLRGVLEKLKFNPLPWGIALIVVLMVLCAISEKRFDRPLRSTLTRRFVGGPSLKK